MVVANYLIAGLAETPSVLSSRTLAAVDRRIRGPVPFKTWGDAVLLDCWSLDRELSFDPSSAFGLARELFGRNVYLRAFRRFSADGQIALDLGGNRGLASVLMAAAFHPSSIVYVEPDTRYAGVMRRLMAAYPATRVEVHHGFAGAAPAGAGPLIALDDVLADEPVAFVKMDIEGAEEALLTGGARWIQRTQRIAMESHPAFCNVANVVAVLERSGFSVRPVDPMGRPCPPAEAAFVYAARSSEDFV